MENCEFCRIADQRLGAVAWQTDTLIVFADHRPIRPGHVQIIPKAHFEVFDDLPPDLATEIILLGQNIARAQKRTYGVDRVGFVFTGNEVPHVHAHVLPLHASDDITSARYNDGSAGFVSPTHQRATAKTLRAALTV